MRKQSASAMPLEVLPLHIAVIGRRSAYKARQVFVQYPTHEVGIVLHQITEALVDLFMPHVLALKTLHIVLFQDLRPMALKRRRQF
jgi:hypothetical protein